MSYQALARKYRPQRFSDIIGQETTVRTLQNAIESGRIHHAYLFAGVRGVGKTTAARILAKALNCVHGPAIEPCNECTVCREITEGIDMDVREIDAATYTGVDNVRELRDVTQFQPARDRYRIFIIDEAHMLSTPSWNALLKLIEEPPPHVVFMFATTEINKVPQTIISRVQKQLLRKITLAELIGRLEEISKSEGIAAEKAALDIIARRGEGSVRDSLSLLDQIIAFSGRTITPADVATVLGLSDTAFFALIVSQMAEGDHAGILEALQAAADSGRDFKMLFRDLLNFIRNLLLLAGGANESMISATPEDLATIRDVAQRFSYSELLRIANLLIRDDDTINKAEHQRLAVEITLLKAATFPRLRAVEEVLSGGGQAPSPVRTGGAPVLHGNLSAVLDRVKKSKPMLAAVLAQATASNKDGNEITWTFADQFSADSINEAREAVETIASEVFGEKTTVKAVTENRRAEEKPASALRDDPVLRAFQKHLGADVVDSKVDSRRSK
jgi:DNA polymerase III subunit gamma/tau